MKCVRKAYERLLTYEPIKVRQMYVVDRLLLLLLRPRFQIIMNVMCADTKIYFRLDCRHETVDDAYAPLVRRIHWKSIYFLVIKV